MVPVTEIDPVEKLVVVKPVRTMLFDQAGAVVTPPDASTLPVATSASFESVLVPDP